MSVNTTVFPAEGASVDTESKDMLLIIASVAMVVATISLILMVRFLERCVPQDRRAIEAKALKEERVKLILEKHSVAKKYEDWIADERRKHNASQYEETRENTDGQIDLESNPEIRTMQSRASHESEAWANDCAVCLTEFEKEEQIRELPCDHIFHDSCIHDWFMKAKSPVCPLCRNLLHSGLSMENLEAPNVSRQPSIPTEPQPLPIVNSLAAPA